MVQQKPASKRHFTTAALAAAIEGRRRAREAAAPRGMPQLFIVRRPPQNLNYGWQIRRFGAVVIEESRGEFRTIEAAKQAGDAALADRKDDL